MSARGLLGLGLLWTAFTLFAVFFILPIVNETYQDEVILKARGVSTMAEMMGVEVHPGSARSGPSYLLKLRFRTPSGRVVMDKPYIKGREAVVVEGMKRVPIVYDPQDVSRAALNLADIVHRRQPRDELIFGYGIVGGLLVLFWGMQGALTVAAIRRWRAARSGGKRLA